MKIFMFSSLMMFIFQITSVQTFAQNKSVIFSFGLNGGINIPIGKVTSAPQDNEFEGRVEKGGYADFFIAYHVSKNYRIIGQFIGESFSSDEINDKLDKLVTGYSLVNYGGLSAGSLTLGLQRDFFINGHEKYCLFLNPNIGFSSSLSTFDYFRLRNLNEGFYNPVIDRNYSPIFNLAGGIEMTFWKHFALKLKCIYSISNFGKEDIIATSTFTQKNEMLLPDVNFGWVNRFAGSVGLAMNLFRRNKK